MKIEQERYKLNLPIAGDQIKEIESGQSIVIVGANGSGKTRLGNWIEFGPQGGRHVHRIAAQKSLKMPEIVGISNSQRAEEELIWGTADPIRNYGDGGNAKRVSRWQQKPNTSFLDDYGQLMVLLFSKEADISISHRQKDKTSDTRLPVPITPLDLVQEIWESVIPHRQLILGGGIVEVQSKWSNLASSKKYNGAEMSDGERVAFYLIGQALSAPKDSILVIDEPELHLHKSIQVTLWREIQSARPDCLFVYITHDVEFAASLTEATKIWLKSYDGAEWDWVKVPSIEGFPEDLLLQVLGSRRPILFVEGTSGSHDITLFQALYPSHTVIPRQGCDFVVRATETLRNNPGLAHVNARGIIDRDRRHPGEISALKKIGVEVLTVAEVENLFCVPEVLKMITKHLGLPETKVDDAKAKVFAILQRDKELQISLHVANDITQALNRFDIKKQGLQALQVELATVTNGVDVRALYAAWQKKLEDVINDKDYDAALRLFNNKGLPSQISGEFDIRSIPEFVTRMLQGPNVDEWIAAFTPYLPPDITPIGKVVK